MLLLFNKNLSGWNVCQITKYEDYDNNASAWADSNKPSVGGPCVVNVTSSNNDDSYGIGRVINISITLTEEVNVMGIPYLVLETGSVDRNATYDSGSGSNMLNFNYTVADGDVSSDLNYLSVDSLKLNGSVINDSDNSSAYLVLPELTSTNSLAGSKNIVIDGVKPAVTVSVTGTDTVVVSAIDDDSATTIMNYKIQTADSCADTVPDGATSYTEGSDVTLTNKSHNTKYVCFWSADTLGNVGKGISDQITGVGESNAFISVWNLTESSKSIDLPLESSGDYNFTVDWGDGTVVNVTSYNADGKSHTYTTKGVKTVTITGKIKGFRFNNEGDRAKLINITNWGVLNLGNSGAYFHGAENLIDISGDPDLTGTTNFSSMFNFAKRFDADISDWDVSNVTSMHKMFTGAEDFNQDIGSWNVSEVTDMGYIFNHAYSFRLFS